MTRQSQDEAEAIADLDDAAVIRLSWHEPERFDVLFRRHAPHIQRYVVRRLGRDAADDIVAETFLLAFRQRNSYDEVRVDARPWLYGIATNLIGRHRRAEIRLYRASPDGGRPGHRGIHRPGRRPGQRGHRQQAACRRSRPAVDGTSRHAAAGGLG